MRLPLIHGVLLVLVLSQSITAQPDSSATVEATRAAEPARPQLPVEVANEIASLESRIADARAAFMRAELEDLDEAIQLAERAYAIRREHQGLWFDPAGQPAEWYEVATARWSVSDLRQIASLTFEERQALGAALQLGTEINDLVKDGQHTEAVAVAMRQLEIRAGILGDGHAATLQSMISVSARLLRSGELVASERHVRKALDHYRATFGDLHPYTLTVLHNLGGVLHDQGRLTEAEIPQRASLEGFRHVLGNEDPRTLTGCYFLGRLLVAQGRSTAAEPLYRAYLTGRRRVFGEHPRTAAALNNFGDLLVAQGKLSEAERYYREALDMRQELLPEGHVDTLTTMHNLGLVFLRRGRLDEAEAFCGAALEARKARLKFDHPSRLASLINMGLILTRQGRLAEAEAHYREALEGYQRGGRPDHPSALAATHNLASLLHLQGNTDEATQMMSDLLERRRALLGPEHPDTVVSMSELGRFAAAEGRFIDATRHLQEALLHAQQARAQSTGAERGRAAMSDAVGLRLISERLAEVLIRQRRFDEAWTVAERGRGRSLLDLLQRSEATIRLDDIHKAALDAALKTEDAARVELVRAEAKLAGMLRENRADAAQPERSAAADAIQTQRDHILKLRATLAEATASVLLTLQSAMPDATPMSIEAVQAQLQPDELLLCYTWNDDTVALLLATREHTTGEIIAVGDDAVGLLTDATMELRRTISTRPGPGKTNDDTAAATLAKHVFPLSQRHMFEQADRFIVMADGPLNHIPFQVLSSEYSDATVDIDGKQIVYAPSATVYCNRRSVSREALASDTSRLVALGGATFDPSQTDLDEADLLTAILGRGESEGVTTLSMLDQVRLHGKMLTPLPFSQAEALAVATLARNAEREATLLTGKKATLTQLEDAVTKTRYLHLATHGLMGTEDRPYDASLALTHPSAPTPEDIGFLTLDHLIRAWPHKLRGCDMVVLSACDTQRGIAQGDSLMALPWGFFAAGASTVVASLWQVDDAATAKLMTRFYSNLFGSHADERVVGGARFGPGDCMSKADALREAQAWLRTYTTVDRGVARVDSEGRAESQRPYEHPYYWAAFVLTGDPGG